MGNVHFIDTNILNGIANAVRGTPGIDQNQEYSIKDMCNEIRSNIYNGYGMDFNEPNGFGGVIVLKEAYTASAVNAFFNNQTVMYPYVGRGINSCNCFGVFSTCKKLIGDPMLPIAAKNISNFSTMYLECQALNGNIEEHQVNTILEDLGGSNTYRIFFNCFSLTGRVSGIASGNAAQAFYNCTNITGFDNMNFKPPCVIGYDSNLHQAFFNCTNFNGIIDANTFNHLWLDNSPEFRVEGKHYNPIKNMFQCFYNCFNLRGTPGWDFYTVDMTQAYRNCYNITGNGVCPPQVTTMNHAYDNCYRLDGFGNCGDNVTVMLNTYANCWNLRLARVGNKVTTADRAFYDCHNLMGTVMFNVQCQKLANTFYNCSNLQGAYILGTMNASLAANAFLRPSHDKRLNIVFTVRASLTAMRATAITGCVMTAVEVKNEKVRLPFVYTNGKEYGYKEYDTVAQCYNEEYNIYMYSTI